VSQSIDEVTRDQMAKMKPADEAQQALVDQVFQEIENDKKNEKANLLKAKQIKSIYK
jgi:hypothetical protein